MAAPPVDEEWDVKYGDAEAVKGWEQLCNQIPSVTRKVFELLRSDPAPTPETDRQHRLRGSLSTKTYGRRELPQWEYEITGGGRVRYLVDEKDRKVYLVRASRGHPKDTE